MSFSFGFDDDDIEIDEQDQLVSNIQNNTISNEINPLDRPLEGLEPESIDLNEILSSLIDTPITFSAVNIGEDTKVYKRELFDVKHQLMVEDDDESDEFKRQEIEALMGNDDLKKFVYEGGLKTWECSVDLVCHMQENNSISMLVESSPVFNVVELGCGTSLPSCYVFSEHLKSISSQKQLNLILSDYNKSVLRLVTVPNLLINWFTRLSNEQKEELKSSFKINANIDSELQVSKELIAKFTLDLSAKNITIQLIAGSWGRQFLSLANIGSAPSLILSSETIYSVDVSSILAETVIELLARNQANNFAVIAAKDIYFGVGGTVIEFLNYLDQKIKAHHNLTYNVQKLTSSGLNRSVITLKSSDN